MEAKEQALRTEYAELQQKLQDPLVYSEPSYPKLAKRQSYLEDIVRLFDEKHQLESKLTQSRELIAEGGDLAELATDELHELELQQIANQQALELALTPKDPNDEKDVIIEIRAGAGGDEASLFAAELYRMYIRWCEIHGYKT